MKKLKVKDKFISINEMNSFHKKLVGLMFKKKPISDGYLFKKTNGIHTFFMFQNIDVILTDKDFKILYLKDNMKPWKMLLPKKNVYYTLELPINTNKYFNLGEILTFR